MTDGRDQDLMAVEDARWEAMTARDTEVLARLFDDRLAYTHATGAIEDKVSILRSLDEGQVRYDHVVRSGVVVLSTDSAAVVTGRADIHTTVGGAPITVALRFSATWICSDGLWTLLCSHSCFDQSDVA